MAVIQKTLFAKNLDRYTTLVNDTDANSKYFKITELPDTFTGGKNAFLVAGSKELVADTKIQIELKDSAGNVIYHEPGEGAIQKSINNTIFASQYFEGVSKVVSVYVYPDTAFGPCTLTILGELSEYQNTNGIVTPVPLEWENKYNVKWTKTINVNPNLANTTKIRFYQRPTATITEILSPIYSIVGDNKVASNVTQSFANIKLSKLETFAGDVKRVKVFRTSEGDISDYDLIQDILIESKELLTSYGLSGSVVGQTGILTSETLKNYWNTGSLNAYLTSSRVESGVRLTGSGYFTYTSSLDIKTANTYELNLDAFYSSSTSSNLGIYLSWVSQSTTFSSSVATLIGTTPTKNLLDTVVPFKIDRDYPSASLYFSQSQGEWHLGNISLKLSQDTAFSPDEISFVTTMPTVLGNETYNFKFEFYDVNNNYVPVAVTQSALFTGGNNNINGTLTLISSSASGSLADLNRVSSSISGTIVVTSGSISGSITTLSGSVSSSITSLSSSVSQSSAIILSSSFAQVKNLANGQYSGSFIGDKVIYSPVIGGQIGYIKELFTVGDTTSATINLDARTTTRKIWIGTGATGTYNSTNTSVYLDSGGQFSLKDKLSWDGNSLSIQGTLKIADGTGVASSSDLSNGLSGKISTGAAASDVNNNVTTISGGKIRTGLIQSNNFSGTGDGSAFTTAGMSIDLTGGGISAKNFRITAGGDAFFNGSVTATTITANTTGTIANWNIDSNRFYKTVAGLGTLEIKSSDNTISMYDTADNLKLQINPGNTQPTITVPSNTTTLTSAGPTIYIPPGTTTNTGYINQTATTFTLTGALNEVFVEEPPFFIEGTITAVDNATNYFMNTYRYQIISEAAYYLYVKLVNTGTGTTYTQQIGYINADGGYVQQSLETIYSNATVWSAPALFSNLPAGNYSLYLMHYGDAVSVRNPVTPGTYAGLGIVTWNSAGTAPIPVTYGSSNAYSVLNAGGLSLYQGSQNYVKAVAPAVGSDSYFTVKGKSTFMNSLIVNGTLSANSKQFQITHPLNEDKWLYHTAIESPGAYLIYKGTSELQNGLATASIDLLSKMTPGTFERLVRRTQFFVQNNSSWDLVRGKVNDGIVYIESNNNNSTASVDWMVVGERKDESILNSVLYDKNNDYKPEKYKSSTFFKYTDLEQTTGSI